MSPFQYKYDTIRLPVSLNIFAVPTVQLGFCYDGRIDDEMLRSALQCLIEKHWPILGGRIVQSDDNLVELRVPVAYSDDVPAYTYDHRDYDATYEDVYKPFYPAPERTGTTIFPMSNDEIFNPPPHLAYETSAELTGRDQPILHLQTAFFTCGKSAVGFNSPHTFFDAGALAEVVKALNLILAGDASRVPKLISDITLVDNLVASEELEKRLADGWKPNTPHIIQPDGLPAPSPMRKAFEAEEAVSRMLFVPDTQVKALKDECNQYLQAQGLGEWVSSGDVIYAWMWKNIYGSAPADYPADVPIGLHTTADARRRLNLPELAKEPDTIWLPLFLTFYGASFASLQAIRDAHLGEVAVRIRRLIKEHLEPDQVALSQAFAAKVINSRSDHLARCIAIDPRGDATAWTNWTVYQFAGKEGSLRVPLHGAQIGDEPARLIWFNGNSGMFKGLKGSPMFWVLCNTETPRKGVWCSLNLPRSWWTRGVWPDMAA